MACMASDLEWRGRHFSKEIIMDIYRSIADEVSVENMLETNKEIVKYERLSGSSDERQAVEYLKKRLDEYGFDTHIYDCQAYISLPKKCQLEIQGEKIYAQTHSMVPSGHVASKIVYCSNQDELKSKNYRGKIVMIPGWATFPVVQIAQDHGAAGMIFIQKAVIRECIPSGCWGSPTRNDYHLFPRIPIVTVIDTDIQPYVDRLQQGGSLGAELSTETDTGWRTIPLLIGELKAPVDTHYFVQFTGHQDSWYYGAIDNGTANALQIEIARLAKKHQDELKRNFRIVFFSGHSHGRYAGSAWYADHFWEDLYENCMLNINNDSPGAKGAEDMAHSIVMPDAKSLGVQIVKELTGQDFVGMRPGRLGDQSFWNVGLANAFASFSRQKKTLQPDGTIGLARGNAALGPGWHTPDDLPKWIDKENYLRDGKVYAEYIMTCLTEDIIPLEVEKDAADIKNILEQWNQEAKGKFDLSGSIRLAEKVTDLCSRFSQAPLSKETKNNGIIKLCRILIPLDFTRGNIYGTEPAMPIDPMPCLTPIHDLVKTDTTDMDKNAILVELTRSVNFINHRLYSAIKVLNEILDGREN